MHEHAVSIDGPTVQLALGEALRDEGVARVDEAEPDAWKVRADIAIEFLARHGTEFTAEDVREIAGDPAHPNAFGARLLAAAKAGRIRPVGYRKSSRPSLHAHPIRVWIGAAA